MSVKRRGLWVDAIQRIKKNRLAVISFWVILFYLLLAFLAKLGWLASPWEAAIGSSYAEPTWGSVQTFMGLDIFGRSVFYKTIHGARVAITVGLFSSLIAVSIGLVLGAIAGFFGGWIDELVTWFYTTVGSIPYIILIIAIAFALGNGLLSTTLAIGLTSWVSFCRVIRGEFMKHKNREYVLAASGLGASVPSKIFKHILPNVFHQVIINFTLLFQTAIKSEVILSYLGLGVQGQPSWGIMIDDARLELARGVWWQLASATAAMFFLVLAFNILGDALRDALDPKLKQR